MSQHCNLVQTDVFKKSTYTMIKVCSVCQLIWRDKWIPQNGSVSENATLSALLLPHFSVVFNSCKKEFAPSRANSFL